MSTKILNELGCCNGTLYNYQVNWILLLTYLPEEYPGIKDKDRNHSLKFIILKTIKGRIQKSDQMLIFLFSGWRNFVFSNQTNNIPLDFLQSQPRKVN